MITKTTFTYIPNDMECEKACNGYLMSFIALICGLPLPIFNLLATLGFWLGNRKGTYFTRWHCTQALLSQVTLLVPNSVGFWWTVHILLGHEEISDNWVAYMITILVVNVIEFITTIITAIQVRKGIHLEWWIVGPLTNLICKNDDAKNSHTTLF